MKRKVLSKLLVSLITASMFLSSCGAQETTGKVENSKVEEKKETGNKAEDSALIEDISWSWSVSDYELWQLMRSQGDVSVELFEGVIDYADGSQGKVKPDEVSLFEKSPSEMEVSIEFRGETYFRSIEVLDMWGDGENLSPEELEEIKQTNSSDTVSDKCLYSESDAPGLSEINWGTVNKYINALFEDGTLKKDVFEVVGKDPRINGDWSVVSNGFKSNYGDTDEGVVDFLRDLGVSYDLSVNFRSGEAEYMIMCIEPICTMTANGEYGDISEDELLPEFQNTVVKSEEEEYKSQIEIALSNEAIHNPKTVGVWDSIYYDLVDELVKELEKLDKYISLVDEGKMDTQGMSKEEYKDFMKSNCDEFIMESAWKLKMCDTMLKSYSNDGSYEDYVDYATSEFQKYGVDYSSLVQ